MKKIKILSQYLSKIELINDYNRNYYDLSLPLVSDEVYDKLKKEILDLEKKNPSLQNKQSPSKIVGFKPSKNFNKSPHRTPMLSLANAFSEEDVINFEKKIFNFLSIKKNLIML
mgnify:FL=1